MTNQKPAPDIKEIPFKELVADWANSIIDMYYCDIALKTGSTTYQQDGKAKSIKERRDCNQYIADKILAELTRRGKTIPDLAAVIQAITGKKSDSN